jgi:A/G-specific adenine glycosylase
MDLGATLCVRGKPDCAHCPFAAECVANLAGRQRELPVARPKKTIPTRRTWMLILRDGPAVLLERRPPTGIWGGLWSLPEAADEAALAVRAGEFGAANGLARLAPLTHTFTHFKLDIEPRLADYDMRAPQAARELRDEESAWVPLDELDAYGVPAPVRKLLEGLKGSLL